MAMRSLYKEEISKPIWGVCHSSIGKHSPHMGLIFTSIPGRSMFGNPTVDYLFYDIEDFHDFALEGRIPSQMTSRDTYALENESEKEMLAMDIGLFENVNSDHHGRMFFVGKSGRIFRGDQLCASLNPEHTFKWGAGWVIGTEGSKKSDIGRKIATIGKDAKKKIKDYLNNPETFVRDVAAAIAERDEKKRLDREERQKERLERIKKEQPLVRHALPTIDEVSVKVWGGRIFLMDKRFKSSHGTGKFDYLNAIRSLGMAENAPMQSKEEIYRSIKPEHWQSYILDVSNQFQVPLFKGGIFAWADIFNDSDLKDEHLHSRIETEIERASIERGNELFNIFDFDLYSSKDTTREKWEAVEKMREEMTELPIEELTNSRKINLDSLTDSDESIFEWIENYKRTDEETALFKGELDGRECFILETMGETLLFLKDRDAKLLLNNTLNENSKKVARQLEGKSEDEIIKFIGKNPTMSEEIETALEFHGKDNPDFKNALERIQKEKEEDPTIGMAPLECETHKRYNTTPGL